MPCQRCNTQPRSAGAREGHAPHRHLATQLISVLLSLQSPTHRGDRAAATLRLQTRLILPALPALVQPIRLALNTFEPHLVCHMLQLLQRLLRSHPAAGAALAPAFRKWLPALALFWGRRQRVLLPPPVCLPPTGRRTGALSCVLL